MNNELYTMAMETKILYKNGIITREEAKEKIKPYEEYYNNKMKELAKKYHQRTKPFNFIAFMR